MAVYVCPETPTPGYNLLNAELSFLFPVDSRAHWEVYLKGHNLLRVQLIDATLYSYK